MRVSLVPDRLFETYEEITPEYLRQRGIRLLLSDLDYTLAPKYVPHPDDRVREWLRRMEEGGVQVMILSNNRSSHRVETFCRELGIPYVGHAQKPRTTGFHRAMEQAGVTAAETAMLGDKLLTDMLGANLAGVLALMVEPAGDQGRPILRPPALRQLLQIQHYPGKAPPQTHPHQLTGQRLRLLHRRGLSVRYHHQATPQRRREGRCQQLGARPDAVGRMGQLSRGGSGLRQPVRCGGEIQRHVQSPLSSGGFHGMIALTGREKGRHDAERFSLPVDAIGRLCRQERMYASIIGAGPAV